MIQKLNYKGIDFQMKEGINEFLEYDKEVELTKKWIDEMPFNVRMQLRVNQELEKIYGRKSLGR